MKKLLNYAREFLRRLYYRNCVILVKRDAGTPLSPKSNNSGVLFKKVTEHNVEHTAAFESASYQSIYKKMLDEGQQGNFGYLDDKCVYRGWTQSTLSLNFQGVYSLKLNKPSILFHYDYCAPEARGKGIHTEYLQKMCREHYYMDCYATILQDNISSMIGYLSSGFNKYAKITVGYFLLIPFHHIKYLQKGNTESHD